LTWEAECSSGFLVSETKRTTRPRAKNGLANPEIREMQLKDLPVVFTLGQELFTAEEEGEED
jgi:hypothetical protein